MASGGIILSATENASLVNAGYVRIGTMTTSDSWEQRATGALPLGRIQHTAVWTGSEMIIHGGADSEGTDLIPFGDGYRYNPAGNFWTEVSSFPLVARTLDTAVWTGSKMIIWGGWFQDGFGTEVFNDGASYDPTSDSWTVINSTGAPSARYAHTAVWTGSKMIIWGGYFQDGFINAQVFNDGASYDPTLDSWTPVSTTGAPAARSGHTAVWTGSEMIIWGGVYGVVGGGRYNPALDSWVAVTTNKAPVPRSGHTAVWTGSEMIVWGGTDNNGSNLRDGGRYNPTLDSWIAVTLTGAPSARTSPTAVWTGSEMIVWGGAIAFNNVVDIIPLSINDGGRYNPTSDSWTATPAANAPAPRYGHSAVWTGNEMIVWGGFNNNTAANVYVNDGGRLNPTLGVWTPVNAYVPTPRAGHTAVWTGSEMIVWGGFYTVSVNSVNSNAPINTGGCYNPALNVWTPVTTTGAPSSGRYGHTAVWTGSEMIVWGGYSGSSALNDGGRYNPTLDSWTPVSATGAPAARYLHAAVWADNKMVVWGGLGVSGALNDGGCYSPANDTWTTPTAASAPTARYGHTAVWAGSEMIVWGGYSTSTTSYLNDGARYNPKNDIWTAVSGSGAPAPRYQDTAVWTGSEMIVWGGQNATGYLNDGGRYNPTSDSWVAVPSTGGPGVRSLHSALWTGSEMIVWGGQNASSSGYLNDGGIYFPTSGNWIATTLTGAPGARSQHSAVWTGSEMIVWGGRYQDGTKFYNDTFCYSPGQVMVVYSLK